MLLLLLVDTNRVCSNQPPFRTSSGLPFVPVFWISRRQRDRVVVVVVVAVAVAVAVASLAAALSLPVMILCFSFSRVLRFPSTRT